MANRAVHRTARIASVLAIFAVSISVCRAPHSLPEPLPPQRSALAERYLSQRLAVWQDRLKLTGWNIGIRMVHPGTLRQGTLGNIRWDAAVKQANIRVLDAADYQRPYGDTIRDMEFTVVHELLHLVLSSLPRSEASRSDEEFAVNRMTDALLNLDRNGSSPSTSGLNEKPH
ncbi:MAG: hypothetical protein JST93_18460 [Acidobacteria bacterium]|nr:hypothetical protein [Acidobacteriota bacterium]